MIDEDGSIYYECLYVTHFTKDESGEVTTAHTCDEEAVRGQVLTVHGNKSGKETSAQAIVPLCKKHDEIIDLEIAMVEF